MKKKVRVELKRSSKDLRRNFLIVHTFFMVVFSALFILTTKVKLTPIFGTNTHFSLAAFFGPTLAKILGISFGTGSIILAHIVGFLLGFYSLKKWVDVFIFLPVMLGGIYFSKMFKGDVKYVAIPLAAMVLFWLHPVGRNVWFYALFWLIPIVLLKGKARIEKILKHELPLTYVYALAGTFVDHAIGSVIYLYALNIPEKFWLMAIPFTVIERLIMAGGITLTYFSIKVAIKAMKALANSVGVEILVDEKTEVGVRA